VPTRDRLEIESMQHPGGSFDPTHADFPVETVGVDAVVDLLEVTHAPERIAEYARAMRRGERFPPISVVRLGRWLFVADGHKRFSACRALGARHIPVEVWPVRRWLRDQREQLARKTWQQLRAVLLSGFDAGARADARRLIVDTRGHWWRILASFSRRLSPRCRRSLPRGSA
jgi:hypothetical protein